MLEKDIVKAIMKYLKTVPGCFAWKEHGGMYGTAGIPDIRGPDGVRTKHPEQMSVYDIDYILSDKEKRRYRSVQAAEPAINSDRKLSESR